jgi:beta-hydroxylase
MFLDTNDFPFTAILEANWKIIRQEYKQLSAELMMPWPEKQIYNQGWEALGLWAFGHRFDDNCKRCPETAALVEQIPGLTMAGFSRLAPGTEIKPHVGYTNTVLRCHLGLIIPDDCGIEVGGESRTWKEGKCLVFDDTTLHSAWNKSNEPRVVLITDFVKPGSVFDPTMSPEAEQALKQILAYRSRN